MVVMSEGQMMKPEKMALSPMAQDPKVRLDEPQREEGRGLRGGAVALIPACRLSQRPTPAAPFPAPQGGQLLRGL